MFSIFERFDLLNNRWVVLSIVSPQSDNFVSNLKCWCTFFSLLFCSCRPPLGIICSLLFCGCRPPLGIICSLLFWRSRLFWFIPFGPMSRPPDKSCTSFACWLVVRINLIVVHVIRRSLTFSYSFAFPVL